MSRRFDLYNAEDARKFKVATILFLVLFSVLFALIEAWLGMVVLGIAHSTDERVPAFGYDTCLALLIVLTMPLLATTWTRRS